MKRIIAAAILAGAGVVGCAFAGGPAAGDVVEEKPSQGGDWCFAIPKDVGVLIDEPDARWVQYFQLGAYGHFQSAFVDGSAGGEDFWYSRGSDWRRVRVTMKAKVFDSLSLLSHFNVVEDEGKVGGGVEADYFGIFQAWAELDLNKVWQVEALDTWSVAYGKRKLVELNEEVDTSINAILTVERSPFATQIAPFRAATGITGGWFKAKRGKDQFSAGLFTTDSSKEFGDWKDGTVAVVGWRHDFSECWDMDTAIVALGGAWQDLEGRDERYAVWEWIVTPWMRLADGRWEVRMSGALANNDGPKHVSGGAFYGLSVIPSWWLIEKRLQAVLRYQVMGSEAPEGVQMNFRYAREAGGDSNEGIPSLSAGYGDFHEAIYAGLVWTVCPKRLTILGGLEWERLKQRDVRIYQGVTGWFATRIIF